MQCQLCASFGDARFKFDGLPMENLRKHSKVHQIQNGRILKGDPKTRSWEQQIFKRCFPSVTAIAGTKSLNVEAEITGRRRWGFLNEQDGNNGSSRKKRRIRDDLEETRQETASAADKSDAIPAQRTPQQQSDCSCVHGIAAIRSHCRELRSKFGHNGKMTCRRCSTTVVVATSAVSAVDHVARCHFGRELYACRFCSKRCTAYYTMAQHVRMVHHKPLADAFTDLSEGYEDEIMELLTQCYGAAAKTEYGDCQVKASEKSGRISTQQKRKSVCHCRGIAAIRSHCRELERKFGHNGKMTCRECSTTLVVATNIKNAVDHVTRCHFGQELYACRLCSKRYIAYSALAQHSKAFHQKSPTATFIDLSEEYENEIMELMTKCYGAPTKEGDNTKNGKT